jgi:hypothetical protein
MNNILPLMQREWLQHRFAWAMLTLVPIALAVLPLSFGSVELDDDMLSRGGSELAVMLGSISVVATMAVVFLLVWVSSLFITTGLPRRDHADRSIEFWLSLPTGHGESLGVPLLVHLVLVPAAAILIGLVGGYAVSLLLVTRFVGFGEWLALPWGSLITGTLALAARVIGGLPLAALWLLPLVLLAMLANAFFKRWGLPVLAVGLGLSSLVLKAVFGQATLMNAIGKLGANAATSIMGASGQSITFSDHPAPAENLASLPGWALQDLGAAVQNLASWQFLAAMVVSGLLFAALVLWRQRGASSGN